MFNVREAVPEDAPRLLRLAEAMHKESGRYSRYPLSLSRLEQLVQALISQQEGCLLVLEHGGTPVGMLWGALSEMFFTRVRIASDILWYIEPHYRKGWGAVKLVRRFEEWGKGQGAAEIQLAVSADIDNLTAVRFAEALKYELSGWVLHKNV